MLNMCGFTVYLIQLFVVKNTSCFCILMKNHPCCSYSVFSQIVSYHALLPHLLWSLRRFGKPCFLLAVSFLFCKPMSPLIQLRVTTPFLGHNKKKPLLILIQTAYHKSITACMYINKDILHMLTFADGDLALRGLPAPAMLSLVPPIFSSPITRSLSSSGRLCREMAFETKCQNKQSLPLKAESRIQQYLF